MHPKQIVMGIKILLDLLVINEEVSAWIKSVCFQI